ncbi:MAG: ATP-binding protein, partial [Henriciella sp.]|uniref:ATP-binding protein n=1 Tax=Henriciella sp. TaxID=1968823 RepID=UPI003C73A3F3
LDFSKIEAGHLEIQENAFCIRSVLDEVAGLVDAARKNKSVPIIIHTDTSTDMAIKADETRVRQVLTNIIGNAAKFTQSGQIDVSADITGETVQIVVADTGIGVSKGNIQRVFEGFRQADSTITRKYGGTGLGLSISRSLAALMGGDLSMESQKGKGTRVTFTLPLKRAEAGVLDVSAKPVVTGDGTSATIIVVDDVEANLSLIELGLKHTGHHLVTFESARKAVDYIRKAERIDLVLMDIQMPDMDGVTATRAIRALGEPRCNVPVIALTANALPSQIAEYKAAGMDDHFAKPIDLDRLEGVVARHVTSIDQEADKASAEPDAFEELRDEYRDYLKSLRDEFSGILASGDQGDVAQKVARLAHAIAGTAGSFGFEEVSDAAFELEQTALSSAESKGVETDLAARIDALATLSEEAA